MAEKTILFEGERILKILLADLGQVMDHSYHVDELFTFYQDWCRRGETFVDKYVHQIYPIIPGSTPEEQEDTEDNQTALRNAMINLYCAMDRLIKGVDRRRVVHAAHSHDEQVVSITLR